MTVSSTILVAPVVSGAGPLLVRRGLATAVGASRATIAAEMLLLELLSKTVGSFVETTSIGGLQVSLLTLVLSLLVGVHEVAIASTAAVAIALLRTPHLLLTGLVWVDGLGKGGGGRGVLLLSVTAKAKGKIQAVALALLLLLLLLIVHGGVQARSRSREMASARGVACRAAVVG